MGLRFVVVFIFLIAGHGVWAQGAGVNLGGLQTDTSAPVEVEADQLQLDQTGRSAKFSGNVVVVQGDMRLTAAQIVVRYLESAEGDDRQIDTITASGGVTLVTPDEAAEAAEGVFTPARNEIVMSGDVLLTQGQNTLAGQRLTVDLETGNGQIDGRVRTVLQPGANE
ncbi:lipopolysaccharide transport periplasmic protein LptA [Qingshengfaniella alkalisoli]|uniref:Lipopolysaccharide transport periplasmic protein LptA n=1 Tax=Qingshengfaniella alkalisoli TaxID=2599296 RepID=A0A5B8JAB6_9RHOB|nr:lipopolysaccharide transport periplasmic protein LptA [Qingshengfaniella alkalisoli]QDY71247.1 lipopolysaccharide transport periplasmic protein LptA [Qingshengfaniella alkalisoli]